MKRLPLRRRALAFLAVALAFLALGLGGGHRRAYLGVAACFLVVGLATLRRGPRAGRP